MRGKLKSHVKPGAGRERVRWYKCPSEARLCRERAYIMAEQLDEYVVGEVLEWCGPAADELVEVDVETGSEQERALAVKRRDQARDALAGYEADVELELEVGQAAYKAGRRARVELVERRERELEELGEASEVETARSTLRAALAGDELDVDERRRLLKVVVDRVKVRRTPYRGAPASERATVIFRG